MRTERYERKRSETRQRGDAKCRGAKTRKPISEMNYLEDTHLRVDVGSGKHAKNSGTRRFRGAVQQVRKIIFCEK